MIGIQPLGRFGQRPEFSQSTGIALVRCILGKFLGVVCHCFHPRLEVEMWARMFSGNFAEMTTSTPFRYLLHAANLRHGTDGFTSPPKEGVLRSFSPLKIRRLRPGLNPRTWVLKASTLPLDHRSRRQTYTNYKNYKNCNLAVKWPNYSILCAGRRCACKGPHVWHACSK